MSLSLHWQWQKVTQLSQVPRPNLRCGSGERTPQELGKKLWSHKTQKISMVIIKSWCLLENCVRGEATDVGVTHSSSSVARQEAVLGHLPFATWVTSHLQLHFTAAITCISLGFLQYLLGISFHISAPSISSEKKTVQAGEVGGPLQFLGEGADRAPWRREKAIAII